MTDLFSGAQTEPTLDPNRNYLEDLVGDGKKFKSPEDLARGKYEADLFIERLKKEAEGLRSELNTKSTLEQYIDKMAKTGAQNTSSSQTSTNGGEPGNEAAKGLSQDDVRKAIREEIEAEHLQRIQANNLLEVKTELQRAFGNDYVNKLRDTAQALGVTEDYLTRMARETPKALLKLVGGAEQKTQSGLFTPPPTQMQTGFTPQSNDRDFAYYEKIRKTNASEYWTPKVQNQMHQDAQRLGEKFFTT